MTVEWLVNVEKEELVRVDDKKGTTIETLVVVLVTVVVMTCVTIPQVVEGLDR